MKSTHKTGEKKMFQFYEKLPPEYQREALDFIEWLWISRGSKFLKEKPAVLSAIVQRDNSKFMAYCPELDLVTAMDTEEEAFEDLVEMIKEYAKEYMEDLPLYLRSPNRASHFPHIKVLLKKSKREIRKMIKRTKF